jgi:hypothetical protein
MVTVQTQYISRAGKPCPSKTTTFAIHEWMNECTPQQTLVDAWTFHTSLHYQAPFLLYAPRMLNISHPL